MAEALRALQREALAGRHKQIEVSGSKVNVGSATFDSAEHTPYKAAKSGKQYTVGELGVFARWFADGVEGRRWAQYAREAKNTGVQTVDFSESRSIVDFLQGQSEDVLLDDTVPSGQPAAAAAGGGAGVAPSVAAASAAAPPDGATVADGDVGYADGDTAPSHSAFEYLKAMQPQSLASLPTCALQSRSSVLCRPQRNFNRTLELLQADRPMFDQQAALNAAQSNKRKKHGSSSNARGAAETHDGSKRKLTAEEEREKQRAAEAVKSGERMTLPSNRFGRMTEREFYANRLGTAVGDLDELGVNPEASFLNQKQQPLQPPKEGERERKRHKSDKQQASASGASASQQHAQQKANVKPIILVPQGLSGNTLVNMHNAKRFLEEGVYEPWDKVRARGEKKETKQTLWRQLDRNKPPAYELTDQAPAPHNQADWGRVVAVIVNGAKWQFKGWPFPGVEEGNLVETFKRIKGAFVCYEDDKVPEQVKHWNVKLIRLKRTSRHNDRAVAKEFWEEIDSMLKQRNSSLQR